MKKIQKQCLRRRSKIKVGIVTSAKEHAHNNIEIGKDLSNLGIRIKPNKGGHIGPPMSRLSIKEIKKIKKIMNKNKSTDNKV